jgi:molybdopterin synthase sulfur carrier subunit
MINVKVRTILTLKSIMGSGETELSFPEESTLGQLITTLVNKFGDDLASHLYEPNSKNLRSYIRLMVNGQDIAFLKGMETVLRNGDEVLILPPVSGG